MRRALVPNTISAFRIGLSPLLAAAGFADARGFFLVLLGVLLASDFADGLFARMWRLQTRLGAHLDTCGDVLMGLFGIWGAVMLWPDRLLREALPILAVLALGVVSGAVACTKHRHLPAYHTWSAKLGTAAVSVGALILFAGWTPLVFRAALAVMMVSAVEETAITLVLPEWRSDVHSIFDAFRVRKASR